MPNKYEPTPEEVDAIIEEYRRQGAYIPWDATAFARKIHFQKVRRAELRQEAQPFFDDLRELDIRCESVYELGQTDWDASLVVPIVLRHIVRDYNKTTRLEMLRVLSKEQFSVETTSTLLDVYESFDEGFYKDNWAGLIAHRAHPEAASRIAEIVEDPDVGDSRALLACCLVRFLEADEMLAIIRPFLRMEQKWVAELLEALGNKRVVEARRDIVRFREHPDGYVREKARRAVSKLDTRIRRDMKARNRSAKPKNRSAGRK